MDTEINYGQIESEIAKILDLENLRIGGHVVRDEKGWRKNELKVEYICLITFDKAFSGKGGLCLVKFAENRFREIKNNERQIKVIFQFDKKGELKIVYQEEERKVFSNLLKEINEIDLFAANQGITLDGIIYRIKIIAPNIVTTIRVNNPSHDSWKKLELKIWQIGIELAKNSRNEVLNSLFN